MLLERFWGFHLVLEPRLDAWHAREPRPGLDWPHRRKLAALASDLAVLGLAPHDVRRLAHCPDVPELTTTATALGVLYVVEGATLGGRVIADHLRGGAVPPAALGFLTCYGTRVGRLWRDYRAATTSFVGTDLVRADEVVAAATATFEVLGRWLAPAGVPA